MRHIALALFVIGVGCHLGFAAYFLAGLPAGSLECAMAGGVASAAMLMAGFLWRQRAKQKPEIVLAPAKWPCQDFAPCTEAERRADLQAMSEFRITLEEWQERRRARPSPPREKSDAQWKEDVRIKVFKEIMRNPAFERDQPACRKCLGIHETETCHAQMPDFGEFTRHFAEMMMLTTPPSAEPVEVRAHKGGITYIVGQKLKIEIPPLKPGDRVRVIGSYNRGRLAKLVDIEGQIYVAEFGGAKFVGHAADFILALPQKGEVWNYQTCAVCEELWDNKWDHNKPFDVNYNWHEDPVNRCRINCGCLYRIGEQS